MLSQSIETPQSVVGSRDLKLLLLVIFALACANVSFASPHHIKVITAADQGRGPEDFALTREIRRRLISDSGLSSRARNVKIVSKNRRVVLAGVLSSRHEQREVIAIARQIAQSSDVENKTTVVH